MRRRRRSARGMSKTHRRSEVTKATPLHFGRSRVPRTPRITAWKEGNMRQKRVFKRNVLLALVVGAVAALAAGAFAGTVINPANAPSGTHLQAGTIQCTVGSDGLTVSCTPFELAGVGNTNALVSLTGNYSGVVDCFNHGGNLVESH